MSEEYLYAVMTDGGYIDIFDTLDEARVDYVKQLDLGEEVYLVKRGPLSWAHRQAISAALRGKKRGGRKKNPRTEQYRRLRAQANWANLGSYGWPRGRNLGGMGHSDDTLHFSMAPNPRYTRVNRRPLREGATPGHGRVIKPKPRKRTPAALRAYHAHRLETAS